MNSKRVASILLVLVFISGCSNMVTPPPPCAGCERVPINVVIQTV